MYNALQSALAYVYQRIPREVLVATFRPDQHQLSIDELIIRDVIRSQVLLDVNVKGGKLTNIMLQNSWTEYCPPPPNFMLGMGGNYSVYRIPPEAREYRPIGGVVSLRYPFNTNNTMLSTPGGVNMVQPGTTMADLGIAALNAQTFSNTLTNPRPVLLAGDLVQIDPPQMNNINWVLECRLQWDEHFTGMEASSILTFRELVHAAVHIYIYTKMSFDADKTYLSCGLELNIMKDYITEGRDFHDRYIALLEEFAGASVLDRGRMKRLIGWM